MDFEREWAILREYLKAVSTRVAFIVLTVAAGISWILSLFGVALVWLGFVLVLVGIVLAQYLTYRKVRLTEKPPSVSITRRPDIQVGDKRLARISVRNTGSLTGWFRARIAELQNFDAAGPEAPFELPWRHGNDKWAVQISPDDDEAWIDIGRMFVWDASNLRTIERERWRPVVYWNILQKEDEPAPEEGSVILVVESADDLTSCQASARITVRHVATGNIVANKWVRYSYEEADGLFVPRFELEDG